MRTAPSLALVRATSTLIWNDAVLRHTMLAATITSVIGYGAISWIPSFLVHWEAAAVARASVVTAVAATGMLRRRRDSAENC